MDGPKIERLLEEIRDLNQEQLAEYRKQATRSVALAEEAVARQKAIGRLYKGALVTGAIVLLLLFGFLLWSMLAQSSATG
jgi:type VI protein secretion system component VasF